MTPRIGTYVTRRIGAEPYKAYIPAKLPPDPPLDFARLAAPLDKATQALAELNSLQKVVPNVSLFLYMYIRKEALLSSQIEGTQSSFSDLLFFEYDQKPNVPLEDVEEVSYYVKAMNYGLKHLQEFPLSLRLLREIHQILLSGGRGASKSPGEFRRSQNWIGGSRPGDALFVPPPVEHLEACLSDFEHFLHDEKLPVLIKAGLAHVQFETIHPFLDGNGRLGRLLIILMFCTQGVLEKPLLYLSLYFKQNRSIYYELLQKVRETGDWESWLEFFLEGLCFSTQQTLQTIERLRILMQQDAQNINGLGRARFSCEKVWQRMLHVPIVNISMIVQKLGMTPPTARSALHHLASLGIVREVSGRKRDKVYLYQKYLEILEEGTEPLGASNF